MALLEVHDLRTQFRSRAGIVQAVDGVSFHVDEGEMLALVGESGCGKSVTAQSIMRLVPTPGGEIVGGQVMFKGRDILTMPARELRSIRGGGISLVPQDPMTSLNPVLPIGRQITESLKVHLGLRGAAARARAVDLLDMVGIPAPATRLRSYPHQFSGGMRQRVMIAMALSCDPSLILADEITTALDVTIQAQILELLKRLTRELGTAVIFITHDLGVVAGMAERVNVMYGGQIVERATTVDLFDTPRMPYTWGLLGSVPRLDQPRQGKLRPIDGYPPNLAEPPPGCRFAPRCAFRRDVCLEEPPALVSVPAADGRIQEARCWGMREPGDGGWLRGQSWRAALREQNREQNEVHHA
ncbi:ABC transporter ATP-binding protein [Phytoactinopolyspora limicola]|uniref:ABC transporter ATP-binding protein n=1 Tax=Phytoactinopolyspora limicola TaxID=2715536 RepID=UPI001A9C53AE|nr:ABC transporter ATP-binding protein [Phytoactinopolyspora limicola]